MTIIQVKVISGHQVKRSNKNRDLELRYMFLGQIFAKNARQKKKDVRKLVRKILPRRFLFSDKNDLIEVIYVLFSKIGIFVENAQYLGNQDS